MKMSTCALHLVPLGHLSLAQISLKSQRKIMKNRAGITLAVFGKPSEPRNTGSCIPEPHEPARDDTELAKSRKPLKYHDFRWKSVIFIENDNFGQIWRILVILALRFGDLLLHS